MSIACLPPSLGEIAARLKTAADAELFGVNQLEAFAAREAAPPVIGVALAEVRRQAQALGAAHRIVLALIGRPELAAALLDEACA